MLQNYNRWRVLTVFFDDPETEFQLREIGRKTRLAPTSSKLHLKALVKEHLLVEGVHRMHKYPVYKANRDNDRFKLLKKMNTIVSISESGLLDYLNDNCLPDAVILFGSGSKGEDVKGSDIDLLLVCKERKLALESFERQLDRTVNIFFCENFEKLSPEFKNNTINGVILKGYLKVF